MQAHAGTKPEAIGEHMPQANVAGLKSVGVVMLVRERFLKTIKLRSATNEHSRINTKR